MWSTRLAELDHNLRERNRKMAACLSGRACQSDGERGPMPRSHSTPLDLERMRHGAVELGAARPEQRRKPRQRPTWGGSDPCRWPPYRGGSSALGTCSLLVTSNARASLHASSIVAIPARDETDDDRRFEGQLLALDALGRVSPTAGAGLAGIVVQWLRRRQRSSCPEDASPPRETSD
jgi:hypothetical protein